MCNKNLIRCKYTSGWNLMPDLRKRQLAAQCRIPRKVEEEWGYLKSESPSLQTIPRRHFAS